jgi:hypothetical protein
MHVISLFFNDNSCVLYVFTPVFARHLVFMFESYQITYERPLLISARLRNKCSHALTVSPCTPPITQPSSSLLISHISLNHNKCWKRMSVLALLPCLHGTAGVLVRSSRLSTVSNCRPSLLLPLYLHTNRTLSLRSRYFQNLAKKTEETHPTSHSTKPALHSSAKKPGSDDAAHITVSEQRRRDWNIVKRLSGNLWPKGDWSTRSRVVLGVGLLVAGKVCEQYDVGTPHTL